MKPSSPLANVMHNISWFLHRFHVIIFVLFVVGGLSIATLLLNVVISTSPEDTTSTPQETFDTATINRLKQLQDSDSQNSNFTLPSGRTSPFN